MMNENFNFEQIRPYNDNEVPEAMKAIAHDNFFPIVVNYINPGVDIEILRQKFLQIKTVRDFQVDIMQMAMRKVMEITTDGVTNSGFDNIDNKKRHMFIANHRDIVLDSAFLDVLLHENGIDTCQITFGSNLMKGDLVINIGKINKMFRIMRGGNVRDFYKNALEVSAYMRHVITELGESVWIAQRNGRTKDGNDKTEIGVLKMFSLSSDKSFVDNFDEISITPVTVSYEYEPCDFLKVAELYISKYQKYEKGENEDLNSILTGIKQKKGHIHYNMSKPITREELEYCNTFEKNDKITALGNIIDKRIYDGYKLFKTNYMAYDILNNENKYREFYSNQDKEEFIQYMNKGLSELDITADMADLKQIFLKIYANPVINCSK